MDRTADLTPPLGKPGGPCQVIRRIEDQVRNPSLKRELVDEVDQGDDLSNSDAAKIYPLDTEPGVGPVRQIRITSHGQYRMDLRGITVDDVRRCLLSLFAQLQAWQKLGSPAYERMTAQVESGDKVEWVDPRTRLKVVFVQSSPGVLTLVSTFWRGVPDPGPMKGVCRTSSSRVLARFLRETD